jgi:hypothetical protein
MNARAACLFLCAAPAVPAAAQQLAYEGGLSVATGEYYFSERTTSWMLMSGLSVVAGRVTVGAGIPIYVQSTTLVSSAGGGIIPTGGSMARTVSDSGQAHHGRGQSSGGGMMIEVPATAVTGYEAVLGDPRARATAEVVRGSRTSVTAGLTVKVPVADTSEYGTGEWDVGGMLSATQWIGSGFLGLDVSYWYLGDMPQLEFNNPIAAAVTLGQRFGIGWVASITATAGTTPIAGYQAPTSVGATLGRAGGTLWTASVTVGLTETVPDLAIAFGWRVGL